MTHSIEFWTTLSPSPFTSPKFPGAVAAPGLTYTSSKLAKRSYIASVALTSKAGSEEVYAQPENAPILYHSTLF